MNRFPGLIVSVAAAAVLALVMVMALRQPVAQTPVDRDSALSVRVYEVPADRADDIRSTLRTLLFAQSERRTPIGHASIPMPGRIVVLAPEALHASIRTTIETLGAGAEAVGRGAPARVRLEAWLARVVPDGRGIDPELTPVASALAVMQSAVGESGYAFADRSLALARADGSQFSLAGSQFQGEVRLRPGDGAVRASLILRMPGTRITGVLHSEVELPDGVPQVIGLYSGRESDEKERIEYVLILAAHRVDA